MSEQKLNPFQLQIQKHLQGLAAKDVLFAETLKKPAKNIQDCEKYIINQVKKSGRQGFADDEIFEMAVHYYDEDGIEVGKEHKGKVVVNHTMGAPAKEATAKPALKAKEAKPVKKSPVNAQPVNQTSLF